MSNSTLRHGGNTKQVCRSFSTWELQPTHFPTVSNLLLESCIQTRYLTNTVWASPHTKSHAMHLSGLSITRSATIRSNRRSWTLSGKILPMDIVPSASLLGHRMRERYRTYSPTPSGGVRTWCSIWTTTKSGSEKVLIVARKLCLSGKEGRGTYRSRL